MYIGISGLVADGKASATYWMNRPKWSGSRKELGSKLSKRKEKSTIEKKIRCFDNFLGTEGYMQPSVDVAYVVGSA